MDRSPCKGFDDGKDLWELEFPRVFLPGKSFLQKV